MGKESKKRTKKAVRDVEEYSIASLVEKHKKKDEESSVATEEEAKARREKEAAQIEAAIASTERMKHDVMRMPETLSKEADKIIKSKQQSPKKSKKKAATTDDDTSDFIFHAPKHDPTPERATPDDAAEEDITLNEEPVKIEAAEDVTRVKSPKAKPQTSSRKKKESRGRPKESARSNDEEPMETSSSLATGQIVSLKAMGEMSRNDDDAHADDVERRKPLDMATDKNGNDWSDENVVTRKPLNPPSLAEPEIVTPNAWETKHSDDEQEWDDQHASSSFSNHVDSLEDEYDDEAPWQEEDLGPTHEGPDYLVDGGHGQQPYYNDNYDYAADQYNVSREADQMQYEKQPPLDGYYDEEARHAKEELRFDEDPEEPIARPRKKESRRGEQRLLQCVTILLLMVVVALGIAFVIVLIDSMNAEDSAPATSVNAAPSPVATTTAAPSLRPIAVATLPPTTQPSLAAVAPQGGSETSIKLSPAPSALGVTAAPTVTPTVPAVVVTVSEPVPTVVIAPTPLTNSPTPGPIDSVSIPVAPDSPPPTPSTIILPTTVVAPVPTSDSVSLPTVALDPVPTTLVTAAPSATISSGSATLPTAAIPPTPSGSVVLGSSPAPTLSSIALTSGVTGSPTIGSISL